VVTLAPGCIAAKDDGREANRYREEGHHGSTPPSRLPPGPLQGAMCATTPGTGVPLVPRETPQDCGREPQDSSVSRDRATLGSL
jgi:hypothetical protein